MADDLKIKVNGRVWPVSASPETPLLYVLTNDMQLRGPRFGCGLAGERPSFRSGGRVTGRG